VNVQDLSDLSNLAQLRGEIGWSTVSDAGISEVEVPTVSEPGANPDVSATTDWLTEAVTVQDSRDGDTRYRAQGVPFTTQAGGSGYLVAWVGLSDVDKTFQRVILVELVSIGSGRGCSGAPLSVRGALCSSSAPRSSDAGLIDSVIRSTRKPGPSSPPSVPFRPAAGAAGASASFSALITRSTSSVCRMRAAVSCARSGSSCTMPSCVVRITSPRCTTSPTFSGCIFPSAPRIIAWPHNAVTFPGDV